MKGKLLNNLQSKISIYVFIMEDYNFLGKKKWKIMITLY